MPTHAEKAQIIRTLAQLGKYDPLAYGDRPIYFHDCDKCVFLGHSRDGSRHVDLYFCEQGSIPTYVARLGSRPDNYRSGLPFVVNDKLLALAFARHMAM